MKLPVGKVVPAFEELMSVSMMPDGIKLYSQQFKRRKARGRRWSEIASELQLDEYKICF